MADREILENMFELTKNSKVVMIVATHGAFPYGKDDRALFINDGSFVSKMEAGC